MESETIIISGKPNNNGKCATKQSQQQHRIKITKRKANKNRNGKNGNKNKNRNANAVRIGPGRPADTYRNSVLYPELKLGARIPSLFPLPTIIHNAKYVISYIVGATTNFCWCFRPFYISDTSENRSSFYYNANANLDGATATGWMQGNLSAQLPPNIASAYRLVSASVTTVARTKLMDLAGRMGQAIHTDAFSMSPVINTNNTTFSISDPEFNSAAVTENSMHSAVAVIEPGVSLRSIYLPFDPSFYNFIPINKTRAGMTAGSSFPDDFVFCGYGTGLTAGTVVEHTINVNFELEPHGSAFSLSLAKRCEEIKSAEKSMEGVHATVKNATDVIKQASEGIIKLGAEYDSQVARMQQRFKGLRVKDLTEMMNIKSGKFYFKDEF